MVMMFAGLQTGEALALTWENVDFKNKIIKVEQGITTVPRFNDKGEVIERVTVISDTKTDCSVLEVPCRIF